MSLIKICVYVKIYNLLRTNLPTTPFLVFVEPIALESLESGARGEKVDAVDGNLPIN